MLVFTKSLHKHMLTSYSSGRFSSKYNHPVPTDKLCVLNVVARMLFQFYYQKTKSFTAACTRSHISISYMHSPMGGGTMPQNQQLRA